MKTEQFYCFKIAYSWYGVHMIWIHFNLVENILHPNGMWLLLNFKHKFILIHRYIPESFGETIVRKKVFANELQNTITYVSHKKTWYEIYLLQGKKTRKHKWLASMLNRLGNTGGSFCSGKWICKKHSCFLFLSGSNTD